MTTRDERGPDPHLVAWLRTFTAAPSRKRCLVVGCGPGDDAEALASAGFAVTAFDASPSAKFVKLNESVVAPKMPIGFLVRA